MTLAALPPRARALVVATVAAGLAAAAAAAVAGTWPAGDLLPAVVVALGVAAAQRFQVVLYFRGQGEVSYAMADAVWLAALFFVEPGPLVAAVAVGVAAGQAAQRWDPVKVAFNTGQSALGVALAAAVFEALGAPGPTTAAGWGAAAAGAAAFLATDMLLVGGVIATLERRPLRQTAITSPDLLVWAGTVALGVVGAIVADVAPAALPLVAVPLALTFIGSRGLVESVRERDVMEALARDADRIAESGDSSLRLAERGGGSGAHELAMTLNRMLDRVEGALLREQRFIREVSHELRTPITVSLGYLDVMSDEPTRDELQETRAVVADELDRLARLVDEMQALTRMEDPAALRRRRVSADSLLAGVEAKARQLAPGQLEVRAPADGAALSADPQRLTQALINLVKNAHDHTPPGTPIRLALVDDGADAWRFEVADDGGGLDAGREEEVFLPFVTAGANGGSGLGLAIVSGIARAHGGAAGVTNRPGRGATFWVEIPR